MIEINTKKKKIGHSKKACIRQLDNAFKEINLDKMAIFGKR